MREPLPPSRPIWTWYVLNAFYWILNRFPHVTIRREGGASYLTRWCLLGGDPWDTTHPFLPFNLFLHCFHSSDGIDPHNHPWRGKALLLRGAYRETRLLNAPEVMALGHAPITYTRVCKAGEVNSLYPDTFHHVQLLTPKVWTLFLAGRKVQQWGFFTRERGFETARVFLRRLPGATSNERIIDG